MTKQILIVIAFAALVHLCSGTAAVNASPQDGYSIVSIFSEPDYRGSRMNYAPGHYALPADVRASSIMVPQGVVVIAYEHSVDNIGYGKWIDFLENQPNLGNYAIGRITFLHIFKRRSPDGYWVRNAKINEQFIEGYLFKARVPGEKAPFSSAVAVVAPPKPAPPSTACTFSGRVLDDRAAYGTRINLFRVGESRPMLSVSVNNGQYTIPNVPQGNYELRGIMGNPMTTTTSRGPAGLKVVTDGDQAVTCLKGQPVTMNWKIVSSGG